MNTPKRAILWQAVSSLEQAADDKISLAYQEAECRALAAERGYVIVDVLSVDGYSRSESDLITALDELRAQGVTAYDRIRQHWQDKTFDVLVAFTDSRLGRSPSLYTHVFDNCLSNHIEIDTVQGGLISYRDRRMRNAMGIIAITADLDRLHDQYQPGMDQRMKQGKPVASRDTFTHAKVRDTRGKSTHYIVREENRASAEFMARLMIEQNSYTAISDTLATFGIRTHTGKFMWDSDIRVILLSPISWGSVARGYRNKHGIWAFDDTVALPEGVSIQRGTHDAMWTGELGEALKEELRRRENLNRGKGWTGRLTAFSGLLVCGYCGYRMAYQQVPTKRQLWRAYCCASGYTHVNRIFGRTCEATRKSIRWDTVCDWFDDRLRVALSADNLDFVQPTGEPPTPARNLPTLEATLAKRRAYAMQLLDDRAHTPNNLRAEMQILIDRTSTEIDNLEAEIARLSHVHAVERREEAGSRRALESLRTVGIENLWALPESEINRYLFAVLGKRKLAVRDGEIAGVVRAE
jgi:hypothetical protein